MHQARSRSRACHRIRRGLAVVCCVVLFLPAESVLLAQEPAAVNFTADQLDSLVAPIALYPDPLLAQTLVAATYPLEIIQLQQWLGKHPELKDKALADAVAKQPWDPSIQSMAAVPEVVNRLADDVQWTTELGNAFLAQQGEVMDAAQRMRKIALDKGALESNEQQMVETKVVEEKTIIVVESANPEVIYVPIYSPTVVYGPPVYPYPLIYYPVYPPGAVFVSFSLGVMWGATIWGGSCCRCGWGGNNVNINVNNNFNRGGAGGGGNWSHNPQHRGAAPYADKATANKYGRSGQRGSAQNRQAGTMQSPGASTGNRATGGARGSAAGPSTSNRPRGGAAARPSGGDSIGGRNIPKSSGSGGGGAFGGSSGGYSGSRARNSSSRGSSSMGSRGGNGRGGGGRRR